MRRTTLMILAIAFWAATSWAWSEFDSSKYGFRILVPDGAKGEAKELGGGWAGLYFKAGSATTVYAYARLDYEATQKEMQDFVIKVTGVPSSEWEMEEQGEDWHGFESFYWLSAEHDGEIVSVLLGHGPKGSYAIFVETSESEYESHTKDFETWGDSIYVY